MFVKSFAATAALAGLAAAAPKVSQIKFVVDLTQSVFLC